MAEKIDDTAKRKYLLRRFWRTARGFWARGSRARAWYMTCALVVIVVAQVYVSYQINVWNRSIFDALEQKNSAEVFYQAMVFFPLALASIVLAVAIVFARMTTQRRWRRWLTNYTVDRWLTNGRYFHLNLVSGDHDNPEYRMAEDVRIATESPIDFGAGILSAFLSAMTFIGVLWFVGGSITFSLGGSTVTIPGFLVIAAVLYAVFASATMAIIGRRYVRCVGKQGAKRGRASLRDDAPARERRKHRTDRWRGRGEGRTDRSSIQGPHPLARAHAPIHAHDGRRADELPDRAGFPRHPFGAEIPRRNDDAGPGHAGGLRLRHRADGVQLARGQLPALRRLGRVRTPRRVAPCLARRIGKGRAGRHLGPHRARRRK